MPVLNPVGVEIGAKYTITGPDGTRCVFNDPSDVDFVGFTTQGVTGLERASIRESADTIPEADGGVHGTFRYERLAFTLQGIIPPDAANGGSWLTRQSKLMAATNAMAQNATLEWTPSESSVPLSVAFRQQQPTRIAGRRPKTFIVAGVSEQGSALARDPQTVTITPSVIPPGGFSSPLISPLGSTALPAGQVTATSIGNLPAWPLITIRGPITNPTITNQTAGSRLRLIYTLADGDTLVLDSDPRARTIKLAGTVNRYSALDWASSLWWPVLPGANDIRLGAESFGAGALLTVAWRDAFG